MGLFIPTLLVVSYLTFLSWTTWGCNNKAAEEAIAACEDTLKRGWLGPSQVFDVKKRLSTLQVNAGLHAQAIPHLDDVIKGNAGTYYDYYNRGVAYSWLDDYKSAAVDFEIAYTQRPVNLGSYQDYFTALVEIKDFAKAETLVLQHIKTFPDVTVSHRFLAEVYYRQNKVPEALQAAKTAVQKNPGDAESQNILALTYEDLGENQPALAAYTEALRLQPNDTKYLYNRALLQRELENFDAAKQDFLKLVESERSVKHLTGLALTYIDLQQVENALPLITEAETIDYKDPLNSFTRGRYFVATGKNEAGRDMFQYTLKYDPNFNLAKYWTAISLYNLSQYEAALKSYAALESVWPENSTIRVDQADTLYELARYEEGLAKAEEAVKLNPKSNLAFTSRGRLNAALEKWDLAIADATTAISLYSENAQSYFDRAYARGQLSQSADAQKDYDKALELAPARLAIAVERAEFMFFEGKIDDTRSIVKKLEAEHKSSANLTRLKGRLADYDGNPAEALRFYETAQRENPNLLWVIEDIAYAQIANDQPAIALLTCEKMLQKLPKAAATHRCFAKAHMRMSQYGDALAALDKALKVDPKFWAAHLDKAYTLLDEQNYEGAVEVFGTLVKEKYRLDTVYFNRGYAYERMKQNTLAVKDYEAALAIAEPNLAKSISASLNSLRAKQPTLRRLDDAPSPQSMFKR
jgi:tetratricopeptide (TPR) repeat protein